MAGVSEYISKVTKAQMKELLIQYQNAMQQKGNPGYYMGKLNEDGTKATLVDGTVVDIITKGLPGTYAPVYLIGGGKGLVDQEEPYTENIDSSNARYIMLFQPFQTASLTADQLRSTSIVYLREFGKNKVITVGYSDFQDVMEAVISYGPADPFRVNYAFNAFLGEDGISLVVQISKAILDFTTPSVTFLTSPPQAGCNRVPDPFGPCPPNFAQPTFSPGFSDSLDSTYGYWVKAEKFFSVSLSSGELKHISSTTPEIYIQPEDYPASFPPAPPECPSPFQPSFNIFLGATQDISIGINIFPMITSTFLSQSDLTRKYDLLNPISTRGYSSVCGRQQSSCISVEITPNQCDCECTATGQFVIGSIGDSLSDGLRYYSTVGPNLLYNMLAPAPIGDGFYVAGVSATFFNFNTTKYRTLFFMTDQIFTNEPSNYYFLALDGDEVIGMSPIYHTPNQFSRFEGWKTITKNHVVAVSNLDTLAEKQVTNVRGLQNDQYLALGVPTSTFPYQGIIPDNERWAYTCVATGPDFVVELKTGPKQVENIEQLDLADSPTLPL
jgi:hypothetical protein